MKIEQRITTKFSSFYCGWGSLEFEDPTGNKISIDISDDETLAMAEKLGRKVAEIQKDRAEKMLEAQQQEDSDE